MDRTRPPKHEHAGGAAAAPGFDSQLDRARAQERAGDFDAALAAYGELARLDPTRREPLQGLRRLYAERGSWDAVLQVAEIEVGLLAPDERARLLSQMARIWERELGDAEQAQVLLARAQQERKQAPPEPAPRSEATTATLVQRAWIAAARGDSQAALSALQEALARDASDLEALDMMLTVLEGAERYGEMAELLERRAALASEDSTRAVVLTRLGALRETQQGDVGSARSAYERALDADPSNRSARAALQRIYRRTESWSALRALLESAAASGSVQERASASGALGQLLEQQLNDPRSAEAAYETARRLVPEDPVATEGLQRLRSPRPEVSGRGAVAAPPRPSGEPPSPPAQPIAGQEDFETATRPFRHLFEERPDAQESASALLELHRARGDTAPLVPLLRQELLRGAADQELALHVELARALSGSDAAAALPHARRAAALAPRDAALLEDALRTAQAAGGAAMQLDLLDDLLDAAPDLGTRAALLIRRADVLGEGLGWSDEAAQCVREALEADPQHAGARARLATLQA